MSRTKPVFQVRNPVFHKVKDYWPQMCAESHADDLIMVCQSHGDCPKRSIKDGHEIRTSIIKSRSEDGKRIETMNSIYEINEVKPMKRFLVFGGSYYYPSGGWGDFRESYNTLAECQHPVDRLGDRTDWWHVVDAQTMTIVKEEGE